MVISFLLVMGYFSLYCFSVRKYNDAVNCYNIRVRESKELVNKYNSIAKDYEYFNVERDATVKQFPHFDNVENISNDFSTFIDRHVSGSTLFDVMEKTEFIKNKIDDMDKYVAGLKIENIEAEKIIFNSFKNLYNKKVDEYNTVCEKLLTIREYSSTDSIENVGNIYVEKKKVFVEDYFDWKTKNKIFDLKARVRGIYQDLNNVVSNYLLIKQITIPNRGWIIGRIMRVEGVTGCDYVTKERDPNGLLGKRGGYIDCVYFSYDKVSYKGNQNCNDLVACGNDIGGTIEVYWTADEALERCKYLRDFDDTLLYSGSYIILGTMVIRTSCFLSDVEQTNLTDQIFKEFTRIDINDLQK